MRKLANYAAGSGLGPFLVRGIAGSGAVRLAGMVASFAVGVLLARGLGVEGYGYFSIALAVITIAAIPGEFGLPLLVTREVAAASASGESGKLFGVLRWADKACVWIAGSVALAIVVGALVIYEVRSPTLAGALLLGAPIVPLIALAKVRAGALQGLRHVVLGPIPANLVRPLTLALLLAVAIAAGPRLGAPIAMALTSVAAGAALVVASIWLKQRLPKEVAGETVQSGRKWLAASIPMGLMQGMRVLQAELSILLVGLIAVPAQVGLLRIATVTATVAAAAIVVFVQVSMPVMARLHAQKDHERLQKTVTGVAQAQFAGVLALCLPLIIFAEPLLELAFGTSFVPAADALRVLALSQILNAGFGPNIWLLSMANHERRVARALGIGVAINAVAVPLLTLEWGIVGAALGVFAAMLTWNVISWWDAKKLLGIETSIVHWPWR